MYKVIFLYSIVFNCHVAFEEDSDWSKHKVILHVYKLFVIKLYNFLNYICASLFTRRIVFTTGTSAPWFRLRALLGYTEQEHQSHKGKNIWHHIIVFTVFHNVYIDLYVHVRMV